jgi:O-antigen ligase
MQKFAYFSSIVLIFLIPWENTITVGEFGTLTRTIGVFVGTLWLLSILISGVLRKFRLFHLVAILFIVWNITSTFWSTDVYVTLERIKTYIQLGFLTCILWDLYRTKESLQSALQAYILGGYVLILSTFYNFYMGHEVGGRFAAQGFNPNDLSLNLALGIPIAFYIAFEKISRKKIIWSKLLNFTYIPLAILVILLTASRGSFLAMVPALCYIFVSLRRFNPFFSFLFFVVTLIFLLFMLPLVPHFSYQRLSTIPNSIIDGDLGGRVHIWNATINYFIAHPLLGSGTGALPSVHNVFLSILAETGLIGFTLFVFLFSILIYSAFKHQNTNGYLWLTVLAVWAIGAMVHNWEHRKVTWLFFNFVIISISELDSYKDKNSIYKCKKIISFSYDK